MIQQRPFTNTDEVRSLLSISHQTATAILSNLLDLGIIKIAGETKINDNTYSRYLFVSEYQEQYNLSKQRKKEKFALWIKQGLNSYADLLNARLHFELVIADENE
jgi:predicted transcriptional regulator